MATKKQTKSKARATKPKAKKTAAKTKSKKTAVKRSSKQKGVNLNMRPRNYAAVIKVVGVGGGGTNAVNRMIKMGIKGVDFVACNTDAQSLLGSKADLKLDLGRKSTRGLGAGANPEVGRQAAVASEELINEALKIKFVRSICFQNIKTHKNLQLTYQKHTNHQHMSRFGRTKKRRRPVSPAAQSLGSTNTTTSW